MNTREYKASVSSQIGHFWSAAKNSVLHMINVARGVDGCVVRAEAPGVRRMRLFPYLIFYTVALSACTTGARYEGRENPAQVVVIASMHRLHGNSSSYGFSNLYDIVRNENPDIVAVEIREEDIKGDESYLSRNYPPEMVSLVGQYPKSVVGFDWLGSELIGRAIPDNYWSDISEIKKLERAADSDKEIRSPEVDALGSQLRILLSSATACSLVDGRYHNLVKARRRMLKAIYEGTKYEPLSQITETREQKISENIGSIIRANPGRKIVVVTGADHAGYVADYVKGLSPDVAKLQPLRRCSDGS
ncbi:hypothetical protein [Sphingosinicella rhizophila]|uniref:Uncharacterized protein n=1 Tax=Sphingosinicella rhizophila TaxID=3050082 RepID=A0ABU3Q5I5_9SPHN|nr:hypothetical protein [Sphingosinicella sp. GR2756]MDT9598674.1 hypothetical protein [Sphingosinicella sp. GR2756]